MRDSGKPTRLNTSTDDQPDGSSVAAVSVVNLRKRYGATEAVCGVTFEVGVGQIFGLLGPNGAGKTTTLECVLGLRQPDAGRRGARFQPLQADLDAAAFAIAVVLAFDLGDGLLDLLDQFAFAVAVAQLERHVGLLAGAV